MNESTCKYVPKSIVYHVAEKYTECSIIGLLDEEDLRLFANGDIDVIYLGKH